MAAGLERRAGAALALAVALLALSACGLRGSAPGQASSPGAGTVERVVDGDTVRVRLGATVERVRLIGIDTPESVKPGTPVQCYGIEASRHLKALLPAGTAVRLVGDVERRDRYGRLLAYVYRARDALFVNAAMVRDGFAHTLTIPPNVAHADELAALAGHAREANRGLWAACDEPP